ncbi:unnamed protein product [Adineta steineri]|uniref:Uncharacterized protein n=1 Tax=Adineta steineri TaxID=433720 RepID=A0A814PZ15_9BILA|nr:unnamed protein product [Adineta steineri]
MPHSMFCLILVFFFLSTSLAQENIFSKNRFKNIIIFGDSYTDTGNVYKLTRRAWPLSPPYHRGRYCNGPNWVDQLRGSSVKNYAYGSATTDSNFVQGYTIGNVPVPGIRQQVQNYMKGWNSRFVSRPDTLHIVWIGGNDFIFNHSALPNLVVPSLMNSINDLVAKDAKNILVVDQVPAQYIPAGLALAPPAELAYLTAMYNTLLNASLHSIQQQYPQTSIHIFSINALVTKVVTTHSDYFTNTTTNCWNVQNYTIVKNCENPNNFVFLDNIHFSNHVHTLIADPVQKFLLPSYAVNSASCYIRQA